MASTFVLFLVLTIDDCVTAASQQEQKHRVEDRHPQGVGTLPLIGRHKRGGSKGKSSAALSSSASVVKQTFRVGIGQASPSPRGMQTSKASFLTHWRANESLGRVSWCLPRQAGLQRPGLAAARHHSDLQLAETWPGRPSALPVRCSWATVQEQSRGNYHVCGASPGGHTLHR